MGTGNERSELEEELELETLYRDCEDEQADIRRLEDRVAKLLTQAAMEEFPALKQMTAPQIRAFGNTITRTATAFALEAAHLAYEAEEKSKL
jgi:hypothetical protein